MVASVELVAVIGVSTTVPSAAVTGVAEAGSCGDGVTVAEGMMGSTGVGSVVLCVAAGVGATGAAASAVGVV